MADKTLLGDQACAAIHALLAGFSTPGTPENADRDTIEKILHDSIILAMI